MKIKTEVYTMLGGKQYYTTQDNLKAILEFYGFKVTFKPESIKGRFRKGYFIGKVTHSFKCFADKLSASRELKQELDILEV